MNIIFHEGDISSSVLDKNADIAIDCEAMGLNIQRDRLCLLQFSFGDGVAHLVKFNDHYECPNLKTLLSDANRVKILHFARFDMAAIYHRLGIMLENVFCTKIASKLVRTYTDAHGLKDLCRELIGINISKQQQSSDWGEVVLSKDQKEYAANDVLYLHKIRDKLSIMLKRENRTQLAESCFKFLATRVSLDLNGWDNYDIFAYQSKPSC